MWVLHYDAAALEDGIRHWWIHVFVVYHVVVKEEVEWVYS